MEILFEYKNRDQKFNCKQKLNQKINNFLKIEKYQKSKNSTILKIQKFNF
jgi:hypothetical protein